MPFALWGPRLDEWTDRTIEASHDRPFLGLILFSFLASDIVLPVPSSTVSVACGYILGLWPGILVSWGGMTLSCFLGYILTALFGRPVTDRLVGKQEVARLETLGRKHGNWAIIIARPVPVLAEASVLFAGLGGMRMSQLMFLAGWSNAGISAVYVSVGAFSTRTGSFTLALLASLLLPGLALSVAKACRK